MGRSMRCYSLTQQTRPSPNCARILYRCGRPKKTAQHWMRGTRSSPCFRTFSQVITLTTELLDVSVHGVGPADGGDAAAGLDAEAEEMKHMLKDYVAGDIVMAYFEKDNNFQPAEIDAVTSEGNFAITWLGFPSSSSEVTLLRPRLGLRAASVLWMPWSPRHPLLLRDRCC